eukprot:PhM_4_TR2085/c2_g1_i1/m.72160
MLHRSLYIRCMQTPTNNTRRSGLTLSIVEEYCRALDMTPLKAHKVVPTIDINAEVVNNPSTEAFIVDSLDDFPGGTLRCYDVKEAKLHSSSALEFLTDKVKSQTSPHPIVISPLTYASPAQGQGRFSNKKSQHKNGTAVLPYYNHLRNLFGTTVLWGQDLAGLLRHQAHVVTAVDKSLIKCDLTSRKNFSFKLSVAATNDPTKLKCLGDPFHSLVPSNQRLQHIIQLMLPNTTVDAYLVMT